MSFSDTFGGGERFLLNNFPYWVQELDMHFIVSNKELFSHLPTANKHFIAHPSYFEFLPLSRKIREFAREKGVEVMIFNGNRPFYFSPFLKGPKKVFIRHSCFRPLPWPATIPVRLYTFLSMWSCDRIIFVSRASRNEFSFVPGREEVIHNGVDTDFFKPAASVTRKKMILVTITRIGQEKGVFECLEALKDFSRDYPEFEFRLVGTGPEMERLSNLAGTRGEFPFLKVVGFQTQVVKELVEGDIFIFPSRAESCPIAVLEAMATGLPILATRVGGIPEIVTENQNGFLFEYFDSDEFKQKLKRLVLDENLRKAFGAQSRKLAVEVYHIADSAKRFLRIFLEK